MVEKHKQDLSFKAYLRDVARRITHINLREWYDNLDSVDKGMLRTGIIFISFFATLVLPFVLFGSVLGEVGFYPGVVAWLLSWFCLLYFPWRDEKRKKDDC